MTPLSRWNRIALAVIAVALALNYWLMHIGG